MRFSIILSGDELTEGRLQDGNGAFLASRLHALGFEAGGMMIVGDDRRELAATMKNALERNDVVVCSGGLGGTEDDLTRFALADVLDSPLELKPEAMEALKNFWARLKRPIPSDSHVEAMMPQCAAMVPNGAGLAPGIFASWGRSKILCLPGVQSELRHMFEDGVLSRFSKTDSFVASACLRVVGLREPLIAEKLGTIMDRGRNPLCGIAAQQGEVLVSLRCHGADLAQAQALIDQDVEAIKASLGSHLYSSDGRGQVQMIVDLLQEKGKTLAVAESLTGGLLGHQLTALSGVSSVFLGDFVTYANEAKTNLLGVEAELIREHGAVSEEVALAMAQGACLRGHADFAVATTGIAGPTGGSDEKPVGLCWVAVADSSGQTQAEKKIHGGSRSEVKARAAMHAFDLLRRFLQ